MKRLFDLLAILLLLSLAVIVFFLFSFHPDQYKREALTWLNQHGEWQVDYHHSEWSLLRPLSLTVHDLQLVNDGKAALHSEQAQLSFTLLPLLRKQLNISELQLSNNKLALSAALLDQETETETLSLPWLDTLQIQQLLLYNTELSYQQQQDKYQLQRLDLAIENWLVYGEHGFDPYYWQLQVHASAQQLITPEWNAELPQLSLAWSPGTLILDHISADIFQGSLYASAEYSQQHLRIIELALNEARLEYFPTQTTPPTAVDLPWLKQLSIDKLLLNQISLSSQWQQQNISVNKLTAELNGFASPWPAKPEQIEADLAFIADEFTYQQLNLSELTANSKIQQGLLHVSAFRSQLYEGTLGLSFSYDWQQQALNIHQLDLEGTELPIQESWFKASTDKSDHSLPLQYLYLEKVNLDKVKLLSYLDDFPFSAQGLNLELEEISLIEQGEWQSLEQLWQPQTRLFAEAPELAYRGMVIKQFNTDLGAEDQLGYFNVYGELPLGQLEVKGLCLLDQSGKPWQAQLNGLLLDVSPLARLVPERKLRLIGDVELRGELKGQLKQLPSTLDGNIQLSSQLLQITNTDLEVAIDQVIDDFSEQQPLVKQGLATLWQAPDQMPKGISQVIGLDLQLAFNEGVLYFDKQTLNGLRYATYLDGSINLKEQHYQDLSLVFSEKKCWQLAYKISGPWLQAVSSLDSSRHQQRYAINQQKFIASPLKQGQCDYRQALNH